MSTEVDVTEAGVEVRFRGLDRALALSGGVVLAADEIVAAGRAPQAELRAPLRFRVGGGYWPGGFTTGWFTERSRKGVLQLWSVYRDPEVLFIDTTRQRPCRLVLQHPDHAALAARINDVRKPSPSA